MNELRAQTEAQALRRNVAQLKEEVQYLRTSQEQLYQEMERLRTSMGTGDRTVTARLDALEADLNESKRAQRGMKDELSKTLKSVLQAVQKPSPGGSRYAAGGYTAREHIVKRGETLSTIAQAYGVKVEAIVKASGIKNANFVREGQKLLIPE